MFDEPYVWPEPGLVFFEHTRTRPDAFTWMQGPAMGEYAYTYWESSQVLIDLACDAPGLLNRHAIPAVFLFRHYVELALKNLILTARSLNDQVADFSDGHKLTALWRELRSLTESAGVVEDHDHELFDVVTEMIQELDAVDPSSMAFRYPVDRAKGRSAPRRPLLQDDFEYFDMRVFRDQATRLAHFLDGFGSQLDEFLNIKRDMDDYYSIE